MRRGKNTARGGAIVALLLVTGLLSAGLAGADADSVIFGGAGNDVLTGTPAADAIYGRAGDDKISGGAGDDELDGGAGADQLSGGEGTDVVVYSGGAPVDANLDGAAGDGAAGENDQIMADVEDLYGGDGGDKLTGNGAANALDGGAGDDRITGGKGSDLLAGGDGDDVIDARDGEIDRIECGAGQDNVTADPQDLVADCEQVSRPGVTAVPLLAIKGGRLYLTSVVSKSTIVVACVGRCGKNPAGATVISVPSAKLRGKNRLVSVKLPSTVRGATVEIGVTAPGSLTSCVRYRITKAYRIAEVKSVKTCTTSARGS
jgi:RTX calcium-binding nonapeptide repeat (4 copies)